MILRVYCRSCSKPNKISSYASDRVELSKEKGEVINVKCKYCSKTYGYGVNDVNAENGILNLILLIGMVVGTVVIAKFLLQYIDKGGVYSMFLLPVGVSIPGIIYFGWLLEEKKRIRMFNKFRK
ncbi:hypothetical protein [Aquimarina celericrescens]|uniref:DUF983 domain-containing protein n=1 Tax=Aquimarina celericrescens TaxID=1964542 RepID=A0ABW5ATC7_9FLAO|nr:hypothetical protein [Aquimarina celericrescens]MBQ0735255.1 hypothetical protein [Aquimarina celericrescens]